MAKKKVSKTAAKSDTKTAPKKKAAKKKAVRKKKTAVVARKRMLWGVFSSSMKEEARFPYDQKKDAEKKLEQLSSKSKKPFFMQPIKEVIAEAPKKAVKKVKKKKSASSEEE